MRLRLLRVYGTALPGDILPDVTPGVAEWLIRRKIAEKVEEAAVEMDPQDPIVPENKAIDAPTDRRHRGKVRTK